MLAVLRDWAGERKVLRFAAACLRRQPGGQEDRLLELVERRADGEQVSTEAWAACSLPWTAWQAADAVAARASRAAPEGEAAERRRQADLLRCLFGNPFRPVRVDPAWLAWHDGTVARMARAIDAERAFDRLPVLADALEEAGCADPQALGHGRGGTGHAPGCWLLDALLDREPLTEPWAPEGPAGALREGGYLLLRRLGATSGGMEFWHALDPGGTEVFVRLIPSRMLQADHPRVDSQAVDRLLRLRHPCLVQTLLCWEAADYLMVITELAEGSLRDRLGECRRAGLRGLPVEELLRYVGEAAEGLDYLHAEGVQHRDVKPENILLLRGHAKVADLGLDLIERPGLAQAAGSTAYMAPEIWRGKRWPASDQYALAVTYAELRLDRRPFGGQNLVEIMSSILGGKPDLGPLSGPERAVLLRALTADPARRYPNCRAFVSALAAALGQPSPPPPSRVPGLKQTLRRWTSRWRDWRRGGR
jgi:hypothetical protein